MIFDTSSLKDEKYVLDSTSIPLTTKRKKEVCEEALLDSVASSTYVT